MGEFNLFIAIIFILGLILVYMGLFIFKRQTTTESVKIKEEEERAVNLIKQLSAESTQGLNKSKQEIEQFVEDIFNQLDEKYQELLFLYSLMDQKKKELADYYANTQQIKPEQQRNRALSKKHKEILEFYANGDSYTDIAKKLNIGQGEVRLVLELERTFKGR